MSIFRRVFLALSFMCCAFVAAAQQSELLTLNIPPQPLQQALNAFAQQAGLQLVVRDQDVGPELRSQALVGTYTVDVALGHLLENSGLGFGYLNERTVAVRKKTGVSSSSMRNKAGEQMAQSVRLVQAETPAPSISEDSREESKKDISEIVVTAQKRLERLQDVPISISVMSGDKLDKSSIEGVADALRRVPGVDAVPSVIGGGTQLNVRGVGTDIPLFSGTSPVAYYVDSVPFGLVKSAVVPDADAYDLSRVEVLRGPQGTLYGAGSLNGVVRVLTRDADLNDFEFKARAGVSSTEEGEENYRGDIAVNLPIIQDELAIRLVAGRQDLGGWIDSPNDENLNSTESSNLRLKINAQPTSQFSVGASYWQSRIDSDGPSYSANNSFSPFLNPQPLWTDVDAFGLRAAYEFSGFTLISASSFLTFGNYGAADFGSLLLYTNLESEVFSQEVTLTSTNEGPWRWSLGGFYRDAEDRLVQSRSVGNFFVDYGDTSESAALYGEIGRMLTPEFELTVGLRYFHDDVANFQHALDGGQAPALLARQEASSNATTPRVVLTWTPNESLTTYVSYSEGFRSGFPQNTGVLLASPGFPALEPDLLRNYEIGAKGTAFDGRLTFDTSVYYMDWEGVQQVSRVLYNSLFVTAPINGDSASGFGVDMALSARPVDGLEIGGTLSWNDLTVDSDIIDPVPNVPLFEAGDRLARSPEYTAGAFVDYSFPLSSNFEGRVSLAATLTDAQRANRVVAGERVVFVGDDLLVSRAGFTLSPSDEHWSATLFIDNVNNEAGGTPDFFGGGVDDAAPRRARLRPRTIGLQFDCHF